MDDLVELCATAVEPVLTYAEQGQGTGGAHDGAGGQVAVPRAHVGGFEGEAEPFLAGAEGFRRALALGDVADDGLHFVGVDGDDPGLEVTAVPVERVEGVVDLLKAAGIERRADGLEPPGCLRLREEVRNGAVGDEVGSDGEAARVRDLHVEVAAIAGEAEEEVGRGLDEAAVTSFAEAQGALRRPALGNVADDRLHLVGIDGDDPGLEVMQPAVLGRDGVVEFLEAVRVQSQTDGIHPQPGLRRRQELVEGASQERVGIGSEERGVRGLDVEVLPLTGEAEEEVGRGLDEAAVAGLAEAQLFSDVPLLGDVEHEAVPPSEPIGEGLGARAGPHPTGFSFDDDPAFPQPGRVRPLLRPNRGPEALDVVRVDEGGELARMLAQQALEHGQGRAEVVPLSYADVGEGERTIPRYDALIDESGDVFHEGIELRLVRGVRSGVGGSFGIHVGEERNGERAGVYAR